MRLLGVIVLALSVACGGKQAAKSPAEPTPAAVEEPEHQCGDRWVSDSGIHLHVDCDAEGRRTIVIEDQILIQGVEHDAGE